LLMAGGITVTPVWLPVQVQLIASKH